MMRRENEDLCDKKSMAATRGGSKRSDVVNYNSARLGLWRWFKDFSSRRGSEIRTKCSISRHHIQWWKRLAQTTRQHSPPCCSPSFHYSRSLNSLLFASSSSTALETRFNKRSKRVSMTLLLSFCQPALSTFVLVSPGRTFVLAPSLRHHEMNKSK